MVRHQATLNRSMTATPRTLLHPYIKVVRDSRGEEGEATITLPRPASHHVTKSGASRPGPSSAPALIDRCTHEAVAPPGDLSRLRSSDIAKDFPRPVASAFALARPQKPAGLARAGKWYALSASQTEGHDGDPRG